jgi:hypothetical protein
VRIDKAWGDDEIRGINDFLGTISDLANRGDPPVTDRDIRAIPRRAGSIDNGAIPNDDMV